MSFRRAATVTGTSIFLLASATLIAAGCGSSGTASGLGGSTGSGGKGTGGKATGGVSGGGSGGVTGAGGGAVMPSCTPLSPTDTTMPVLFDFNDMTSTSFGDYTTTFTGNLFTFNGAPIDVSTGAWKVSQNVTGFGDVGLVLAFPPCNKVDLSMFTGIQFDVSGTYTAMDPTVDAGIIPAPNLTLSVGTPQDEVNSVYDNQNQNAPTWGTCVPTGGNQYDGSCADPAKTFALTTTLTTQSFLWTAIAGGKGQPGGRSTPDPTQITAIRWFMPYNNVSYHAEITIDNIRLMTGTTPPPVDAGVDVPTTVVDAAPDAAPAADAAGQ